MAKYGEPWEFEAYPADDFAGDHGWGVLVTDGEDGIEVAGMVPPEYGNRAAACVNFCAGYTLPDDVTLGDLLTRIRELRQTIVYVHGEDWDTIKNTDELLAKFKKED